MNQSNKRLLQMFAFLAAWAVVVIARLIQVQLVRHDHYVQRAQKQQERTLALNPVRGSILDARGRVLAESVTAESVCADPSAVTNRPAVAKTLAPILGMTPRDILAKLNSGGGGFAWIARKLPHETAARVKALRLPGIYTIEEHRRSYPRAALAANVIGYTGLDGEGLAGIEHSLEKYVSGTAGKVTLLQDARRSMYLVGGDGANRPRDGHHVVLTIDAVVQFIAERALAKAVTRYRATGGSVIVLDPSDGAILAMASAPTFDPNRFREFTPDDWRNRPVQDQYEPGSTFKIVMAAAGLEEGLVTPSQIIDCGAGAIRLANVEINEHGGNQYGPIPFEEVMVHSSNVGSVKVALSLGQTRFYDYIRRFGFGERTGIALPGEALGMLRDPSKWSQVSIGSISIGQEVAVTPLQLIRAMATVANGGVRVEPRLVDRVVDDEGKVLYRPPAVEPKRVVSERTTAVLNEILKAVVARGTGVNARLAEHIVAGKTGTAQKAGRGGYSAYNFVASFAGYVPADRPRLVMLVVVDEPHGGQYGGEVAAPVFREIAEASLRYLGVPPSIPSRSIGTPATTLAAFSQSASPSARTGAVPDLRGLDARAAVAKAIETGLLVRAVGSGVVTSQDPLPGGALPQTKTISLTLAEGAR